MSTRPVEQALSMLLPTHATELPPELLNLAQSLVAQSRSYATSLKPEEEIARPYACAEMACKRLTRTLKLPPLLGHPPCPPRVYNKLYAFLDRSLARDTVSTRRSAGNSVLTTTPVRPSSIATTPTKNPSARRTPSRVADIANTPQSTPTKSTSLKRVHAGGNAPLSLSRRPLRNTHNNNRVESTNILDAPAWVMSCTRTICNTLSTPAPLTSMWSRPPVSKTLPPHIFTGVSSVLHFVHNETGNKFDDEHKNFVDRFLSITDLTSDGYRELVIPLIVAVYFIALARRRSSARTSDTDVEPSSGGNIDDGKKLDAKTFSEMRWAALSSAALPPTQKRHRDVVDSWIALIMNQGWTKGKEWFENIPTAGADDTVEDGIYDKPEVTGLASSKRRKVGNSHGLLPADGSPRGGLLPGLGTMMQDRVDWLSPERREDYIAWKAGIMKRIENRKKATTVPVS
ncbi:Origin recognition complex, subunit 6 [Elaphomyces granulatus]